MASESAGQQLETALTATNNYIDASKEALTRKLQRGRTHDGNVLVHSSDLLDLLKMNGRLAAYIQELQVGGTALNKHTSSPRDMTIAENAHAAATDLTAALKRFVVESIDWDPLFAHPTQQSPAKALEVFYVPELAEMIIMYLSTRDLFSAAQANKALNTAISCSEKLLARFDLQPRLDSFWSSNLDRMAYFSSPEDTIPLLGCFIARGPSSQHPDTSTFPHVVTITTRFYPPEMPLDRFDLWSYVSSKVGSRGRAMLICQPPILEMKLYTRCCSSAPSYLYLGSEMATAWARWAELPPLKSPTGLTIGDLLDAGAKIEREHRFCPYAPNDDLNTVTGENRVRVIFRGELKLREDDPALERANMVIPTTVDYAPWSAPDPKMDAYKGAKQMGVYHVSNFS